jgi:hypothetical protein
VTTVRSGKRAANVRLLNVSWQAPSAASADG